MALEKSVRCDLIRELNWDEDQLRQLRYLLAHRKAEIIWNNGDRTLAYVWGISAGDIYFSSTSDGCFLIDPVKRSLSEMREYNPLR